MTDSKAGVNRSPRNRGIKIIEKDEPKLEAVEIVLRVFYDSEKTVDADDINDWFKAVMSNADHSTMPEPFVKKKPEIVGIGHFVNWR